VDAGGSPQILDGEHVGLRSPAEIGEQRFLERGWAAVGVEGRLAPRPDQRPESFPLRQFAGRRLLLPVDVNPCLLGEGGDRIGTLGVRGATCPEGLDAPPGEPQRGEEFEGELH
jgi:hypothetical protein